MSTQALRRTTSAVFTALLLTLSLSASPTRAAVVPAAPSFPIANAVAAPPPIPALPPAAAASPPADQITDPLRSGAPCGGWHQQSTYGDRWQAASSWWEYACTDSDSQYHSLCTSGACDAYCPDCWSETQEWTDYFYWDGSNAVFYGQLYSDSILYDYQYYDGSPPSFTASWWDGPTAQWYVLNAYPLSVSKQGSGSGVVSSSPAGISCGSACKELLDAGSPVTLIATPDSSSVFAGWSGDCSGAGACEVTTDQARSVAADFEPKRFALSVATAGSGSGLVYMNPGATGCRSCQQSYDIGTSVTLTVTPDPSSVFTGWSGDCSGTGACKVTMDQARSVTATFASNDFALTVAKAGAGFGVIRSTPAGIDCGSTCQASFGPGSTVTLAATADASSVFTGWSGDCTGVGACQVTMSQARSVTATFAPNAPPRASFTFSCTGLGCTFNGGSSADSDGTITAYSWAFGDGTTGSGASAQHTYGLSGTYAASLTVVDDRGASTTVSKVVSVTNIAPSAAFTVTCSGLHCVLDATGSTDADGLITTYGWNFGDGVAGSLTTKSTTHDYPKAGTYTITLTVTDNAGASASVSKRINPISLSARGYKQNGQQKVDLSWTGTSGASFDVYRNGAKIATVAGSTYTDNAAGKGSGSYSYEVCSAALSSCSDQVTVNF